MWLGAPAACGTYRSQPSARLPDKSPTTLACLHPPPHPAQDSAVGFLLQLDNGAKVQAHVFLCYSDARPCRLAAGGGGGGEEDEEQFAW